MNRFALLYVVIFLVTLLNIMPKCTKKESRKNIIINLLYDRNTIGRLPSYAHYRLKIKVKAK